MPTVCASVPMHAPATRTLRPMRSRTSASISSIDIACAAEGAPMSEASTVTGVLA